MLPFNKFNSLTLIRESRQEELDFYRATVGDVRCVVTEKIHGANFKVVTDGKTAQLCRRNGVLEEGDSFYGHQYISGILADKAIAMFNDVKEMVMEQHKACDYVEAQGETANRPDIPRDFQELSITGELAGGHYPAEDVLVVKEGHGQVGKGTIWYSQDKSFYAFELSIDDVPQDHTSMGALVMSYGIPLAPVLFYGTFEECLEYSKEHLEDNTVVPTMQPLLDVSGKPVMDGDNFTHLPVIEGNQREGHVISPLKPMWFPNGKRVMFKHKGKKFMEDKGDKKPKVKVQVEFTKNQRDVFDSVLPLLTPQRLEVVQSKEGPFELKDFPKACGLVISDALDELVGDGHHVVIPWTSLNTKERKQVTKQLGFECTKRLREVFFN